MRDYKLNYWIEAVSCAFDEYNIPHLPTEAMKRFAEDMQNASEMQGQAFGLDAIPNPKNSEIEELKKKHEKEKKEWEQREMIYKQSVANRRGVNVQNVYIEGESVMYDR